MLANDFAVKDGILRVHMIGHGEEPPKSDSFLLEYNGAFVLIDGGLTDCRASLDYLTEIRRTLLLSHPELQEEISCRLQICVMVSHCHHDHVGALYSHVFPSPFIEVSELYMPPDANLDEKFGLSGDVKYRPIIAEAIRLHQPQARVVDVDFGAENRIEQPMIAGDAAAPVISILPPWKNSADPEWLRLMCDALKHGENNPNIATLVTNNNSMWIHIRHGENTFLFTGDTVKKNKPMGYEMPEEMIRVYADVLGQVDVVKYVHHGYKRDAAAEAMLSLSPKYLVTTTVLATADAVIREKYPDHVVKLLNCGIQTYIFASDGKTLTVSPEC